MQDFLSYSPSLLSPVEQPKSIPENERNQPQKHNRRRLPATSWTRLQQECSLACPLEAAQGGENEGRKQRAPKSAVVHCPSGHLNYFAASTNASQTAKATTTTTTTTTNDWQAKF